MEKIYIHIKKSYYWLKIGGNKTRFHISKNTAVKLSWIIEPTKNSNKTKKKIFNFSYCITCEEIKRTHFTKFKIDSSIFYFKLIRLGDTPSLKYAIKSETETKSSIVCVYKIDFPRSVDHSDAHTPTLLLLSFCTHLVGAMPFNELIRYDWNNPIQCDRATRTSSVLKLTVLCELT